MPKDMTRRDYAKRIGRVVDALAHDLDRRWRAEDLAAIAAFSPFHFHRVYRAMTRETVAETVRRLRLHRAAVDLLVSAKDVSGIARRAGYGSVAAFTRAFADAHGAPPALYRTRRRHPRLPGFPNPGEEGAMPEVTIENIEPMRLVGVHHLGSYQDIGRSFERVMLWLAGAGLIGKNGGMIGVYFDDPDQVPVAKLRSFAGVIVADPPAPPDGFEIRDMPAMTVASLVHKGPYAELPAAYQALFKDWLPGSGRAPGAEPCFEAYLNDPRTVPPSEWLTKVNLPLAA